MPQVVRAMDFSVLVLGTNTRVNRRFNQINKIKSMVYLGYHTGISVSDARGRKGVSYDFMWLCKTGDASQGKVPYFPVVPVVGLN